MSRKRSRKVLYEVSTEAQEARKSGPRLEFAKRVRAFSNKVESRRAVKSAEKTTVKSPRGSKRHFVVLLGRLFSFSIKKSLVLLAVVATIVILWPSGGNEVPVDQETSGGNEVASNIEGSSEAVVIETETPIDYGIVEVAEVSGPPKDHCILIASHKDIEQLKPVAKYFSDNGIETEFRASGSWQTLITKDRYLSTGDPQSRANLVKKQIIEIGDEYKPPTGFGSFTFDSVLIKKVSGE